MQLFAIIEEGIAILRGPNGIFKQVPVYQRGDRVYVGWGNGFIRVCAQFGGRFTTSHPKVLVEEIEAEGVSIEKGEPRYTPGLKAVA